MHTYTHMHTYIYMFVKVEKEDGKYKQLLAGSPLE